MKEFVFVHSLFFQLPYFALETALVYILIVLVWMYFMLFKN
jgi:hypothetical protein